MLLLGGMVLDIAYFILRIAYFILRIAYFVGSDVMVQLVIGW